MIVPEPDQDLRYKVIPIPKYHVFKGVKMKFTNQAEKQFMTRVLYSGATPFKTTFHADSTLFFCDSEAPREILNNMKNSDVDFAMSSRIIGNFSPSGWALLYNWNPRIKLFLRDWLFEMLNDGITITDDQAQIFRALKEAVREHFRTQIKNKPKEITGRVLIKNLPKITSVSGKYIVDLDFFVEKDRIIQYTQY